MNDETPRLRIAEPSVSAEQCPIKKGGGGVKLSRPLSPA